MTTLRKSLLTLALTAMIAPLAMANPAPQPMDGGFAAGKGGGKPAPTPTPKPPGPPKSQDE